MNLEGAMPIEELPQIPGYRVLARLGVGASGVSYRAVRDSDGRELALKILHAHLGDEPASRRRFLRECRLVQRLEHAHIVRMLDVFEWHDAPVLAMELVQGTTLEAWRPGTEGAELPGGATPGALRDAGEHRAKAPGAGAGSCAVPTLSERLLALSRVASALGHAHRAGVVHRDVKPSNILVGADGHPYLIDFGLARQGDADSTITHTGEVGGSPAYMSPEHYHDLKDVDARSDIWSLGVVVFELSTGRRPFDGTTRMSLMRSIVRDEPPRLGRWLVDAPPGLEGVIQRALEKDPAHRYQDADELASDLERVAQGAGTPGPRAGTLLRRELRRVRRGRMLIASLVILLLVAGLMLARRELDSRAVDVAVRAGRAQLDLGHLDGALAAFARATEIRPHEPRGERWTATAYLLFDRWLDAQEAMQRADGRGSGGAAPRPDSGVDQFHAGVSAVLHHDWRAAEAYLVEALRLDPSLYEAHQPLAQVGRALGASSADLSATLERAQRGLRPANPRSRINAALISELRGELTEALAELDELERSPEYARSPHHGVHRHRGRILLGLALTRSEADPERQRAAQASVDALEQAVSHNPRDVQALANLSGAELVLGRFERAGEWARELLAQDPSAPGGLRALVSALTGQRRFAEARAVASGFVSAADREQALVRIDLLEGRDLRGQGPRRLAEAQALFERCVAAEPGFVAAWIELAYCLNDLEAYEQAYAAFEQAARLMAETSAPVASRLAPWAVARAAVSAERLAIGKLLSGCGCRDEPRATAAREAVRALLEGDPSLSGVDLANLILALAACELESVRDCDWAEALQASPAYEASSLAPESRAFVRAWVERCRG